MQDEKIDTLNKYIGTLEKLKDFSYKYNLNKSQIEILEWDFEELKKTRKNPLFIDDAYKLISKFETNNNRLTRKKQKYIRL